MSGTAKAHSYIVSSPTRLFAITYKPAAQSFLLLEAPTSAFKTTLHLSCPVWFALTEPTLKTETRTRRRPCSLPSYHADTQVSTMSPPEQRASQLSIKILRKNRPSSLPWSECTHLCSTVPPIPHYRLMSMIPWHCLRSLNQCTWCNLILRADLPSLKIIEPLLNSSSSLRTPSFHSPQAPAANLEQLLML